jgi:hypothetical protein
MSLSGITLLSQETKPHRKLHATISRETNQVGGVAGDEHTGRKADL